MVEGDEGDDGGGVEEENEVWENGEGNVLSNANQHGSGAVGSTTETGGTGVTDPFATSVAAGMPQSVAAGPPGGMPGNVPALLEMLGSIAPGGVFGQGNVFCSGFGRGCGPSPECSASRSDGSQQRECGSGESGNGSIIP